MLFFVESGLVIAARADAFKPLLVMLSKTVKDVNKIKESLLIIITKM